MARRDGSGPIGLRLALAFIAVALCAVGLLAGLTSIFAAADVSHLAVKQQAVLTQAMAVAASTTWEGGRSWDITDLDAVLDLAAKVSADVEVLDRTGRKVTWSAGYARDAGFVRQASITVSGQPVGTILARFAGAGLGGTDQALRTALWQAIAGASGLAALVALLVAVAVSRRISRPVERLIEVTRAMGGGDRAARVGEVRAPTELRDLAATFDTMADALTRQEQLRRNLVADVTHELRTPVAVLQAGHEALLDGVVAPTPAQLTSLRDEVLRLARMVDDLQILASADAAGLQLAVKAHDLAEIAAAVAESMAYRFDTGEITLERRLSATPVLADDQRIRQIISNLLGNAIKFTPAGGKVTLEVRTAAGLAVLTVSDTGAGIPPDELPYVFERFWRGRNSSEVAGSGIGLAIVAELVRAHHGDIGVTSVPGRGTRISISLPGPSGSLSRQARRLAAAAARCGQAHA